MEMYLNDKPKLILNPRIGQREKFWPASRVADLFLKCHQDYGLELWIIAGDSDQYYVEEIADRMGREKLNTISLLELDTLGKILKPYSLFIGPDSGTSRLAASLGVPTIMLFGATRPYEWTAPPMAQVEIICKAVSCSPCSLQEKRACRTKHCFTDISIDEVIGKVKKLVGYGEGH